MMNQGLLTRLRGFQIPPPAALNEGGYLVARLQGVDFEGILLSPDFGFTRPIDVNFGKMMVRTASHLLGGDACGRYGHVEQMEMSVLLDRLAVGDRWSDATELQSYLVALASSKMSLELEDEAIFSCRLYVFAKPEIVIAYYTWRQQESSLQTLDRYCNFVLSREDDSPGRVANILEGLGPLEKEEILRQNAIEYAELPAWQRWGTGVRLGIEGVRVNVETDLPRGAGYGDYLQQYLG